MALGRRLHKCLWCDEIATHHDFCPACLRMEVRIWRSRFILSCWQLAYGRLAGCETELMARRLGFIARGLVHYPLLAISTLLTALRLGCLESMVYMPDFLATLPPSDT